MLHSHGGVFLVSMTRATLLTLSLPEPANMLPVALLLSNLRTAFPAPGAVYLRRYIFLFHRPTVSSKYFTLLEKSMGRSPRLRKRLSNIVASALTSLMIIEEMIDLDAIKRCHGIYKHTTEVYCFQDGRTTTKRRTRFAWSLRSHAPLPCINVRSFVPNA